MTQPLRIQTGGSDSFVVKAVANNGNPITGLTDLYLNVRRESDGFWYDFSDDTYKTRGSVTTIDSAALTEIDATNLPGWYELSGLFDFSLATNPTAGPTTEERYMMVGVQVGGTNANLPDPGEVVEGGYVDYLDAALSDIETDTQDIQSRLPAALVGGRMDSDVGNMQTDTVDAAAIAADAIGSSELATSAVNEIRDSILSDSTPFDGADIAAILADTAAMQPTVATNLDATVSSRATQASVDTVDANVDAILVDTADMQPKLGTPAADISADIAAVKAETASIQSETTAILADTAAIDARLPPDPADASVVAASHASITADIAALNDLDATGVENAVWDATQASHVTAGTTGESLDNAGSGSAPSAGAIATAVWTEALPGGFGAGEAGKIVGDSLDAAISSRAVAGDAMDLIAGSVDAGALDVTAVAEIADGVWDEAMAGHTTAGSAGQQQNRLDVDVSSRAAPGAAMDLITGALDSDAVATSGANEIRDSILSDSTPFAGANIDAAISSRGTADAGDAMTLTPAGRAVLIDENWDEPTAGHTTAGTTGKALIDAGATADPAAIADAVWDETAASHVAVGSMGQLQNRIDVTLSTRAATGAPMDLIANAVDASALAASAIAEIADGVWDEDITTHAGVNSAGLELSGKAEPGAEMDLVTDAVDSNSLATSAIDDIADQVWEEQLADHSGTAGSTAEALDNVSAPASPAVVAAAVWAESLPGAFGAGEAGKLVGDSLDAAMSSRSSHSAADVETLNAAAHGAGSHATATGFAVPADIAAAHAITDGVVAAAHVATDGLVAAVPAATEGLNTAAHGAGPHVTATGFSTHSPGDTADAVWDESLAAHQAAGSTGEGLTNAAATADPGAIADAVWDEAAGDHVAAGSMGEAQGFGAAAGKIDSVATLDPSLAATGSLLDRLANKDGTKTYDQSLHSLQGIRERQG